MPLEMILTFLPSTSATATITPARSISLAFALVTTSPASARISPVSGAITGSASLQPARRAAMASFLLYLYLPTREISYLRGSKKRLSSSCWADSRVTGSPGRRRLKTSMSASPWFFVSSLSMVASILSSLPKNSRISSSVPSPSALMKVVMNIFLFLSILT